MIKEREAIFMTFSLNNYIDHTLLKPEARVDDIIQLCQEAETFNFAAVCVNPCYAALAAHFLRGTKVHTATVIGFPLGANKTSTKVQEVKTALEDRVDEFDVVINIGALKSGQWDAVLAEIKAVVEAAENKIVKVIVETALLTTEEKRRACELVLESGAHFIKTSTGFAASGAAIEDIVLFKSIIGDTGRCGIKASGGIKTAKQALAMINAGATRIGTSNSIALMQDF
jgi:deoxyribose-phosphate aldolase